MTIKESDYKDPEFMLRIASELRHRTYSDQLDRENIREIIKVVLTTDKPILLKDGNEYPWQGFDNPSISREYDYETFPEFLKKWSKYNVDDLRDIYRDDIELLNMLDVVMKRPPGKTWDSRTAPKNTFDNIQGNSDVKAPTGTSKTAGLRRLRNTIQDEDAPAPKRAQCRELQKKVLAGDMSVHAAMLQAGFRKRTKTVSIESPQEAVRALLKVFSADDLIAAITSETN